MSLMTGPFPTGLGAEILTRYFKNTTVISPVATVYVGLASAIPTNTTFTELANSNAYARQSCAMGSVTAATATAPSYVQNSGTINFPAVTTSAWSAVLGWGIWDSGTYGAGNLLAAGPLTTSLSFTAITVADPGVMNTGAHGLTTGTTYPVYVATSGATITGAGGPTTGVGLWLAVANDSTHLTFPFTCTVTGTGTVLVPTGSVTCQVNDVFQFAANSITVYL